MTIEILTSIDDISPSDWDRLAGGDFPFLRHAFLAALEHHHAVGPNYGWWPRYFLCRNANGLQGAVVAYIKSNSYGELVFDWAWAEAYQRAGLRYYPKLVVAVPYTPATAPRLLLANGSDTHTAQHLLETIREYISAHHLSGLHWLFPDSNEAEWLAGAGLTLRHDLQYHWHNAGYQDFDDYLRSFNAEYRKKIRRERHRIAEQGITVEQYRGDELPGALWSDVHAFYREPFERKGGIPTLSQGFFEQIGTTMGEQLLITLARQHGRPVAAAINFVGRDCLYGRHWGCSVPLDGLHFELCYYQGIDYCIRNGLNRFEPGAQGEYKISRGFVPVTVYSAHWLEHPGMHRAVADYVAHEKALIDKQRLALAECVPFRRE